MKQSETTGDGPNAFEEIAYLERRINTLESKLNKLVELKTQACAKADLSNDLDLSRYNIDGSRVEKFVLIVSPSINDSDFGPIAQAVVDMVKEHHKFTHLTPNDDVLQFYEKNKDNIKGLVSINFPSSSDVVVNRKTREIVLLLRRRMPKTTLEIVFWPYSRRPIFTTDRSHVIIYRNMQSETEEVNASNRKQGVVAILAIQTFIQKDLV